MIRISNKAFTIVELLVVITIIGILSTIVIISYTNISQRADAISMESELNSASKVFEMFYIDNDKYPREINCNIADSPTNKCIRFSPGTSIIKYSWNEVTMPKSYNIQIKRGETCYNLSDNAILQEGDCYWIPGRKGSALENKSVYYQNVPSSHTWGGDCNTSYCQIGLDPSYPSDYALKPPPDNPGVTYYPAQNQCGIIGGRLPYLNELLEVYNLRNSYYYGVHSNDSYPIATQYSSTQNRSVSFSTGSVGYVLKSSLHYVKCVKD